MVRNDNGYKISYFVIQVTKYYILATLPLNLSFLAALKVARQIGQRIGGSKPFL